MWPPFLSLKILGLGRQVNWLYRPACVGRLCHSKYKMAATSDILYKSTALVRKSAGLLDSDYCMSRVNISISSTRSDLNPRPMERKMDHELLL